MKSAVGVTLMLSLLAVHVSSNAQIFVCKDGSGRTLTSDRPIPECADRTIRVLDGRGNTKRVIEPPLTAEQKRKLKEQEEQRKSDAIVAAERSRIDLAIRTRYRSEADIEMARGRATAPIEEKIRREKNFLADAEKQKAEAQAEADTAQKKNRQPPAYVQRTLDDATQSVIAAKKQLEEAEEERTHVSARYDDTLKRFRELSGMTASR
ncbi:hypothetical protein [Noviherbaspirillum sp. Root189]|uniref:hypothetical protein n=1 Tax=Noviherbaspirillum sp. Root189 TaxID=1736487 RepID=UPI00070D8D26|nr:hypothetical protein [Noviherbaspirillum sp. Root189]KRB87814.1 hypothetical protein ASE07_18860 [Noviherbaspirillum sp. Root189]